MHTKLETNRVDGVTETPQHYPFYLSLWLLLGLVFFCSSVALSLFSHNFSYDFRIIEKPMITFVMAYMAIGGVYLILPYLIHRTPEHVSRGRVLFLFVFLSGVLMRLVLLNSEPVLQNDYHRYLWDGAVTAQGLNPYQYAPKEIPSVRKDNEVIDKITKEAGDHLRRINNQRLRTIYPPVTQAAFALAYMIKPFSLVTWRMLLFSFDIMTFVLLLQLLLHLNRSWLWSVLYWWNPVVIKELFNSTHMEALLIPFVLGALWLALQKRHVLAGISLVVAAGVKVWPVLLIPILCRPLLFAPKRLVLAVVLCAGLAALLAWPILSAGLNQSSGFVTYAAEWQAASALFPTLKGGAAVFLGWFDITQLSPNSVARGIIILAFGSLILWLSLKTPVSDVQLVQSMVLVVAALFLLNPAQYPWYYLWVVPFLCLWPVFGLTLITFIIPLYYTVFYFITYERIDLFDGVVIWVMWVPVWVALAFEVGRGKKIGWESDLR